MAEEEAMDLSEESNLVSNLHNFSFDVSWSTNSHREYTPPTNRRMTNSYAVSPARFLAPSQNDMPSRGSWKTLSLKPVGRGTPTVKISQSATSLNRSRSMPSYDEMGHDERLSPMQVDQSNNNIDKNHVKKSRSTSPKLVIPDEGPPVRRRLKHEESFVNSSMDNSVFVAASSDESMDTRKSRVSQYGSKSHGRKSTSTGTNEAKTTSWLLGLVMMVVCIAIGIYIYTQMEKCSVFDVDIVKLNHKLEENVFGQHIAVRTITEAIEKFGNGIKEGSSKRHLVMSFHGWTGIGKNYISNFIAEAFYNAKVTWFLVPLHFLSRVGTSTEETHWITSMIVDNVTECGVNVMVFDEIDKAEPEHLVAVKSAVEIIIEKSKRNVTDASAASHSPVIVFIFLGNSRARQINQYLFSQLLNDRDRELMRRSEFDDIFKVTAGEWYESFKADLIDHFVPFLPLAESHVKQCVERDFIHKGRDPSMTLIAAVMEELSFFDMGGRNGQMSLTGCKRVADKVDLHMDD